MHFPWCDFVSFAVKIFKLGCTPRIGHKCEPSRFRQPRQQESSHLNYDEVLRILRRRNQTWLRRKLTA